MTRNMFRAVPILAFILTIAWMAADPPAAGAASATQPTRLRVMTINIFYGGNELNLTNMNFCSRPHGCPETLLQVIETIRAANPDVVGIEEAEHDTRPIAEALGYHYSERMQIISRYPLIDPPGAAGIYIFAALQPGRVVALANVHLPSDPYGPYLVRDGAPAEEVRALEESLRLPAIQDQLARLPGLAAAGIPVFLTGDFNTPSHLDWTPEVAAVRDVVHYPFVWPVGAALAAAGFRDSYRVVHPDPVAVPGFTWTPGGPESVANEVHDRIDWVLSTGTATAVGSQIVGEVGGPDVDIAMNPYPTDHRGVVSTFDVTPGTSPVLVAVSNRRLTVGDDVTITFHAQGKTGERVGIVPAGGSAATVVAARSTGAGAPIDGSVVFSTAGLAPRAYEAVLLDTRRGVVSRSPFWLYAPGAPITVATDKTVYAPGEPIGVSWTNAPGMRWDWLGVFSPAASDTNPNDPTCEAGSCGNTHYMLYEYTHNTIEGTTFFTASSPVGYASWPLPPGIYEIRMLLDDGFRLLAASAPFKVEKK